MIEACSFEGCEKSVFVKETDLGGLCNGHYAQFKKGKQLVPLRGYSPRIFNDQHSICPVEECGRPSWHKEGYCQTHKKHANEGDQPNDIRTYEFQQGAPCQMTGCYNASKSKGYCASHYRQDWGACEYPGCTRKMYNKRTGYCASHYNQFKHLEKAKGITISDAQDKNLLLPVREKKESSE